MTKLVLSCEHGSIGSAFRRYMAANYPEIEVITPHPFPFLLSRIDELTRDKHVRYFVNCCGRGEDAASVKDPYDYFDTNSVGPLNHLEFIRRNAPDGRIRYLNLGSIYEKDGTSPYAASKRAAREVIRSYRENHGLYALQCYLGFTESPGRADTYLSRKIVRAAVRIKRALDADEQFDSLHLRDIDQRFVWTWADDVAEGMWRMLNQEEYRSDVAHVDWSGETLEPVVPKEYALMSGNVHSVREFVEAAFSAVGLPIEGWATLSHAEQIAFREELVDQGHGLGYTETHRLVRAESSGIESPEPLVDTTAHIDLNWHPRWTLKDIVAAMVAAELKTTPPL